MFLRSKFLLDDDWQLTITKSVIYSHWLDSSFSIHTQCYTSIRNRIFTLPLARAHFFYCIKMQICECVRGRKGEEKCEFLSLSRARARHKKGAFLLEEKSFYPCTVFFFYSLLHLISFLSIKLILTFLNKWYFHQIYSLSHTYALKLCHLFTAATFCALQVSDLSSLIASLM